MLELGNFEVIQVSAVVFSPSHYPISHNALLATVLNKHALQFNGAVQALPLTTNLPQELPRVILKAKTGEWEVNAGLNRLSSTWMKKGSDRSLGDAVRKCVEPIISCVDGDDDLNISRLGLVVKRAVQTESPARELVDRFCNEWSRAGPFRNTKSFQVHNHKRYESRHIGLVINSWIRCSSAITDDNAPVVLVEHDINTIPEDLSDANFTGDQIGRYFTGAAIEADEVLSLYFSIGERRKWQR